MTDDTDGTMPVPFDRYWCVRTRLPERQGDLCRVLVRRRMNSCLVEFEYGVKVVTSCNFVRRVSSDQTEEPSA